ncbi:MULTISPECIES: S8 family serine peptidase [unclassified Caballeronia]|uniref:S8 family serine peptidase n=1 Tax=unclassified Caballeronia TaxID=2646786 RepID=UPI0028579FE4|nr:MULTISPECIES: S8 family serine peptidase [unclassified Caballeronia]MDR5771154.1 S8 family serine peptidase [Caballeronia sp. LZ002]MDR5846591.1 S8 family serine peptidase [Caballeronia sp. LZ003]
MRNELILFRNFDFDGVISVRYIGPTCTKLNNLQVFRDNVVVETRQSMPPDQDLYFENMPIGKYRAKVIRTLPDGTVSALETAEIDITGSNLIPSAIDTRQPGRKSLKGGHRLYDNIEEYYIEVKFEPGGLNKLRREAAAAMPLFLGSKGALTFSPVYSPGTLKKRGREHFAEFYRIAGSIPKDQLIPLALELETRDYVIYCSVTPNTAGMAPPESPPRDGAATRAESPPLAPNSATPDFASQQTYLEGGMGMNVRSAWKAGATGYAATVRHLDFGVYRNHEDLRNITVVTSRPETDNCNHGTASTGCVAATANGFGVTGVAFDCRFYFYDISDIDRLVSDAREGDVIGLNIQFMWNSKLIPVIDNKSWWDKIYALYQLGATVILAAGNGGLDLSRPGVINDYGDCGGLLAGACDHSTGRREYSSNYGHHTSLINSWGDWSVTTTGYGDLQALPGNDRNYTSKFSGTSSATALSVGAVAVVQSHSLYKFGVMLHAGRIGAILALTGAAQALEDGIGHRPDVGMATQFIDMHFE